jgi:hypothetical protein
VFGYLNSYNGNLYANNVSVTNQVSAKKLTTTDGVFWANGAPYQSPGGPIVMAYNSASQNLSTGTINLVYSTATVNIGNYYDPATGRFTPLIPGYYQINATVYPSGGTTGSFFLGLYKNGSPIAQGTGVAVQSTWGQTGVSSVSVTVPFNGTTDYINCAIIGTSVVGPWVTTTGIPAYFQACWLRPL